MERMVTLNADLGEGSLYDAALMKYIKHANIACGGHAGNIKTISKAVELAIENNVFIGAHPSYPDIENFGRVSLFGSHSVNDLTESIATQLSLFQNVVSGYDLHTAHVKPHGALYNDAMKNDKVSKMIIKAVLQVFGNSVSLVGMPGTVFEKLSKEAGFNYISEGFADRQYLKDLTLKPRAEENAVLHDDIKIHQQIKNFVEGFIIVDGEIKDINVDTICIHSDTNNADIIAAKIYLFLKELQS